MDSLPIPIYVKNADHRYALVNDAACEMLGATHDQVIGKTEAEALAESTAERLSAQDQVVLATGLKSESEESLETIAGKSFWVLKTSRRVRGEEQADYVVGALLDLTERHAAEQNMSRARVLLDQILDTLPNPIFVKDSQRRWVLVNKAFCDYVGRVREDLIGNVEIEASGRLHHPTMLVNGAGLPSRIPHLRFTQSQQTFVTAVHPHTAAVR